jgi:hypothetical protein
MRAHAFLVLLVLTPLLAPMVRADDLAGSVHVVHVTDTAKHSAGGDDDVTYMDYQFEFSGNAPDPNAANPADQVGGAWILLNVHHKYHSGGLVPVGVNEENTISYTFTYNTVTVLYQTTMNLHAADTGTLFRPGNGFDRSSVTVHYVVYVNNTRQSEDTQKFFITNYMPTLIPDTRFWLIQENDSFTITPDFDGHGVLPRFFDSAPPDSPGRVVIENQSYQYLEMRVSSTRTLATVSLAYGFAKQGETPGWTLGSLAQDALTTIAGAIGNFVSKLLDFVFQFVPQGDKIILVKDFVSELVSDTWDVAAQDPLLLWHVVVIVSVGYGLLIFIDPLFAHLLHGFWLPVKAIWHILKGIWIVFFWLVQFAVSKIP